MSTRTTKDVIQSARETLAHVKLGLQDVCDGGPKRRLGGLRNLVVFGRAVTNVLQNLRSPEPTFDSWYEPYVQEMKADRLLKYFYDLRTEILKKGTLPTGSSTYIHHFEYPRDMGRLGPPPVGAKGFFMGDQAGGSGWEIEGENGEVEKFYIDLPGDIATFEVHLLEAPREHRGKAVSDTRIETLATLYFDYLAAMVEAACRTFGTGAPTSGESRNPSG